MLAHLYLWTGGVQERGIVDAVSSVGMYHLCFDLWCWVFGWQVPSGAVSRADYECEMWTCDIV